MEPDPVGGFSPGSSAKALTLWKRSDSGIRLHTRVSYGDGLFVALCNWDNSLQGRHGIVSDLLDILGFPETPAVASSQSSLERPITSNHP